MQIRQSYLIDIHYAMLGKYETMIAQLTCFSECNCNKITTSLRHILWNEIFLPHNSAKEIPTPREIQCDQTARCLGHLWQLILFNSTTVPQSMFKSSQLLIQAFYNSPILAEFYQSGEISPNHTARGTLSYLLMPF